MAPRYSRYLLPVKGGRFPGRVLCLSVSGRLSNATGTAGVERMTLDRWAAVLLVRKDGAYRVGDQFASPHAQHLWDLLRSLLARPGTTWVVSPCATRSWALLGLWERLEQGSVTLRRPAVPLVGGTVSALRSRREGTILAEDPPSLFRAWMPGAPGTLCWMDPRNWGADCSDWASTPGLVARRCAGLVQSWCIALQSLSLGSLQGTAGSQALHGWLAGYFHPGVWAHTNPAALALEEDGFHGGRAEARRLGRVAGRAYYLDIRSAYPWACSLYDLPVRLGGFLEGEGAWTLVSRHGGWNCLAEVLIDTDVPRYPVRRGVDTIYPVGKFRAVLPGPELRLAVETGDMRGVLRAAWYVCRPALRDYAVALHKARCQAEQDGNPDLASCIKALLVALPGKLAQRSWNWQTVPNYNQDRPYASWQQPDRNGELFRYRSIAFQVQRCVPAGWSPDAVPAMAAWITSAVRVRLLEEIERAGWEHVLYVDTDGLIVDEDGINRLSLTTGRCAPRLGELTLRACHEDLDIRGIKHYAAGGRTICAGLPHGSAVPTPDGERYWQDVPPTEQIRRRVRPDAVRELHPYERHQGYRHGVVGPDGNVSPIRLEEW